MKKFLSLLMFLIPAAGCASSPIPANTMTNVTNAVGKTSGANVATVSNGNEANASNAITRRSIKGIGFRGPQPPQDIDTKNARLVIPTTGAPDNSAISSAMDSKGTPIETRTFKNHPILLKVERIFVDIKNPQMRIYLKNGKIIELAPGKISDASTASAGEILQAAGLATEKAVPKNSSKKELEKPEKSQKQR